MKFQIRNRRTGHVQFECELSAEIAVRPYREQLGFAIREAVSKGAVLSGADLSGAVLSGADLTSAVLRGCDLSGVDLTGAVLTGVDLTGAVLSGVDLTGAVLSGAVLSGADLTRAVLSGADLSGVDLTGAVLTRAVVTRAVLSGVDLTGAELTGAVLSGADLSGAVLSGAVLTRADLSGAVLSGADLTPIRDDLWAVLSAAPAEAQGLRNALAEGRVDGSSYSGECACLVGTLANVRGIHYGEFVHLRPNADRPAERFFLAIQQGDTPETNQASRLALEWVDQWLAAMRDAFGGAQAARTRAP